MLPILHSAGGRLELNGKVIAMDNLARLLGATLNDIEVHIAALEEVGLLACDDVGYYCPAIVQSEGVRRSRAAGGRKGGNPALLRRKANEALPITPTPSVTDTSSAAPAKVDVLSVLVAAGTSESIARASLSAVKRRLGAEAFEPLVAELVASTPPNPLAWLIAQCDARATPRAGRRAMQIETRVETTPVSLA